MERDVVSSLPCLMASWFMVSARVVKPLAGIVVLPGMVL